jgi:hypothetical protein
MKIEIPTVEIKEIYDNVDGTNNTRPEPLVTITNWLNSGRIEPQTPSVLNDRALYKDGDTVYDVTRESLLDIWPGGDGLISEHPMVWQADREIFDLAMPTSILAARIPSWGGDNEFPNINKYTATGTSVKTVGEWLDSLCEVWYNSTLDEVQVFSNPINNTWLQFHLVRAFALEFRQSNHPSLSKDTEFITIDVAQTRRDGGGWTKLQP